MEQGANRSRIRSALPDFIYLSRAQQCHSIINTKHACRLLSSGRLYQNFPVPFISLIITGFFFKYSCLLPASCWLLACLILWLWRWKRHVPPKRLLNFDGLHGVISRMIERFLTTAVRTSNPTLSLFIFVQITRCLRVQDHSPYNQAVMRFLIYLVPTRTLHYFTSLL
jgi:hypothetical protein